jgi:thioredoxin 1
MAKFLETVEEFEALVKSDGVVVVDFFATWCGPCKMLMPVFDQVSGVYDDKAKFVKVDIDQFQDLAREHNVTSVPSVYFFKDGKLQEISKGYKPSESLSKIIDNHLESV